MSVRRTISKLAVAAIALLAAGHSTGQPFGISPQPPQGTIGQSRSQAEADGQRWTSYRDFWFDYGSSRIDPTDKLKVADVASHMSRNPAHRLALDGEDGEADMGDRRVASVREALIEAGVPAYKIYSGAYGDPRLRRARRVEVLFGSRE